MRISASRDVPPALVSAGRLISVAVICAILYWAQVLLIPLALAALITFLVSPLVTRLGRWGLPRILAVLLVAGSITGLVGGLGYVVAGQLGALAAELPEYRENIRAKVSDLRALTRGGTLERVQRAIEDLSLDIQRDGEAQLPAPRGPAAEEPVRVEIDNGWLPTDTSALAAAGQTAASVGLAILLSIFMLIKREDLRNRLVSVAGEASLAVTTKAFAEAGKRISRFLLMQFIINATMGIAVGTGLYLIGVPYAALWGLSAALLRYIPYVGPWVAALLPIAVSIVTAPGWEQVVVVIGLFVVLELLSNNVMEPWLYGHSVGLSPIAVIVSAIFWTWLWGPVGLLLATPITACLVVLSRYIPALGVFDRLLSERPALEPHLWLYQRLLARDEAEAAEIVSGHLARHSCMETYERLLLGTLLALKSDLAAGRISSEDADIMIGMLAEIIAELPPPDVSEEGEATRQPVLLIGLPVSDEVDALALELLAALLRGEPCTLMTLEPDMLVGERIEIIEARQPSAVCIVSLAPDDPAASRHAAKRLRARLPMLRLIVARLGERIPRRAGTPIATSGGERDVAHSLADLRERVRRLVRDSASASRDEPTAASSERAVSVVLSPAPVPAGP